jgi:hypothetical protein
LFSFSPNNLSVEKVTALICILALTSVSLTSLQAAGSQAQLQVSVAEAGVDEYDLDGSIAIAVENFDNRDLVSHNAPISFSGPAGVFSGIGWIQSAGLYGGAGGTGRYAAADSDTGITLTMPGTSDYKYIGFWWSAGNAPNDVELIREDGDSVTFSVDAGTENLQTHVGNCRASPGVTDYCGNPNQGGAVDDEPYAFVHLRYEPGFREVVFTGAGFEFDNVTVSMQVPPLGEETVLGGFEPFEISTAPVLLADPRASFLRFPGVELIGGEQDAMVCFSQSDSDGASLAGPASIEATGEGPGIALIEDGDLIAFYGLRDDLVNFSSSISFQAISLGQRFGVNSVYMRVDVTPDVGSGIAACSGTDANFFVVEVRSLTILQSNSMNIPLG